MTHAADRSHWRPLLAIALASFAILFFQIATTRILSVVLWYHWAFLCVSPGGSSTRIVRLSIRIHGQKKQ